MVYKNKHRKKRNQILGERKILLTLQMVRIAPRHFQEIQSTLQLSKMNLNKILLHLEELNLIDTIEIDINDLPKKSNDNITRFYPARERNGIQYLNPLKNINYISFEDKVTFFYATHRGMRYLAEGRFFSINHRR